MSRTSWVAAAIIRARNNDGATACENARTLATEVERLEKKNFALQWESAKLKARVETAEADSARHKRNEELQMTRAIKAEARVKELEREAADSAEEWAFCGLGVGSAAAAAMKHMEILKKYREQNARLRAALFKLRAAAHHAEIWLTSCLDCKDWMWSEHQHEAATEARDDLKAALNGEGAST